MALPPDFAARVRAARAYAGVPSQKAFGAMIRTSGTTVKNYEGAESRPADRSEAETVRRLAEASGLPEWFFTVPNLKGALMGRGESPSVLSELHELRDAIGEMRSETRGRYDALDRLLKQREETERRLRHMSAEEADEVLRLLAEARSRLGRDIGKRDLPTGGATDRQAGSGGAGA